MKQDHADTYCSFLKIDWRNLLKSRNLLSWRLMECLLKSLLLGLKFKRFHLSFFMAQTKIADLNHGPKSFRPAKLARLRSQLLKARASTSLCLCPRQRQRQRRRERQKRLQRQLHPKLRPMQRRQKSAPRSPRGKHA